MFQNACMVYKHAYLNTLLLLHLCSVWLEAVLKEVVGGRALNSHGNYMIVDHGKSWKNHGNVFLNICGNPVFRNDLYENLYYTHVVIQK